MSFRLVPNSVTLDDLERRNSPNCSVISPNSVLSGRITYKWLKIHQYLLQQKCNQRIYLLTIYHYDDIGRGSSQRER